VKKTLKRKRESEPWSVSKRSTGEQQEFRKKLLTYYECEDNQNHPSQTRCMLLNEWIQKDVIAAHILPYKSVDHLNSVGLKTPDIMNERNGMMLYKTLEKAFDELEVCFCWDPFEPDESKRLKFKVLNPFLAK